MATDTDLFRGTRLHVWSERDRLHINLTDRDDETIAEWWDDDARALCQDYGISADNHREVYETAKSLGRIENVRFVYSIDAWRDADGGWYENDRDMSRVYVNVPDEPRALFAWMRRKGLLTEWSKGRVEYDRVMEWVCQRSDHRPLFGIEDYHNA